MKSSRDGFAFVADCFGKNLFKNVNEVMEEVPVKEVEIKDEDVEDIPMQSLEL